MKKKKLILGIGLLTACAFVMASCGNSSNGGTTNSTTINNTEPSNTTTTSNQGNNTDPNNNNQGEPSNDTPKEDVKVEGSIEVKEAAGDQESLYAEFYQKENVTTYNAYVKLDNGNYSKLDSQLVRYYKGTDKNYYRVDAVGLKAGNYTLKIVAVKDNEEILSTVTEIKNLSVKSHDRSGFAFVNGTSSGAYNEDGTLRENAQVLYITETTKDTVSLEVVKDNKGRTETATGLQNILNLYKKGMDSRPLDVRFIGQITDFAVLEGGDIVISGSGATKRVSCGITFEGIGNDATLDGWGIRIKNASNVEIRNLGFMNCDSSEGDDCGLQQDNDHVWVHNCDFFYGGPGGDADQAKGDGALDTKDSTYVTHSYNHFFDCGKCNLLGLSENSNDGLYATYHHNWYDHSDSRHPRVRFYTVHVYNNYFDGNAKYGVGATLGSSVFVENNYFRNCKYPMLTSMQGSDVYGGTDTYKLDYATFSKEDGGSIKSYGNTMVGTYTYIPYGSETYVNSGTSIAYNLKGDGSTVQFDAYEASSREEQVPSTVTNYKGTTYSKTYNNFDTASTMYQYTVETAEDAKNTVINKAGRVQGGDFKWTFDNSVDDESYAVNTILKAALVSYTTKLLSVQSIGEQSSGSGSTDPIPSTSDADSVIALIEALPESTAVTENDRTAINAAKAAYDALDETEQAKVTNYPKLQACIAALPVQTQTAQVLTFPASNSFFTVSGNTSTSKGSVTYNGNTYSTCLKMEKSTSITFTLTESATITIVFGSTDSANVKIDDAKENADSTRIITKTLSSGSHTITKADSANVFYISIE